MLPADVARCTGGKSVRGQPLPPCVRCERRIWPECEVITVHKFKPVQVDGAWQCDGHIPYEQEAA